MLNVLQSAGEARPWIIGLNTPVIGSSAWATENPGCIAAMVTDTGFLLLLRGGNLDLIMMNSLRQ